jgi:hypothetical protein
LTSVRQFCAVLRRPACLMHSVASFLFQKELDLSNQRFNKSIWFVFSDVLINIRIYFIRFSSDHFCMKFSRYMCDFKAYHRFPSTS